MYEVVAAITMTRLPLVGFLPVQPPLAVQAVASVVDQVRVSQEPGRVGCHMSLMSIAGMAPSLTVTVALAGGRAPAGPVQVSV